MFTKCQRPKSALDCHLTRAQTTNEEILASARSDLNKAKKARDADFSALMKKAKTDVITDTTMDSIISRDSSLLVKPMQKHKSRDSIIPHLVTPRIKPASSIALPGSSLSARTKTPNTKKMLSNQNIRDIAPVKRRLDSEFFTSMESMISSIKCPTNSSQAKRNAFLNPSSSKNSTSIMEKMSFTTELNGSLYKADSSYLDDYYVLNGYYHTQNSEVKEVNIKKASTNKNDIFYKKVEKLIEKETKELLLKINQKKEKEATVAKTKSQIEQMAKEKERKEDICQKLASFILKQEEKNNELEKSTKELMLLVNKLRLNRQEKENEFSTEKSKMDACRQKIYDVTDQRRVEYRKFKDAVSSEKEKLSKEVKALEGQYIAVDRALETMKKKAQYSKFLERTRMKAINEKAKIMNSLILHESVVPPRESKTPTPRLSKKYTSGSKTSRR